MGLEAQQAAVREYLAGKSVIAVPRSSPTRSMVSMAIEFPCPFVIRRPLRPSFDAGHRACRRGELDASSARARQEGRPCAPAGRAS